MSLKKHIHGILAVSLFASAALFAPAALNPTAAAAPAIKVTLDGKTLSMDTAPQIVNNRLLVPYSSVITAIGGTVDWNAATKKVTAKKDGVTVTYTVGSKTATVGSEKVTLEAAPVTVNNRTLVPLRFLAESFGMWVKWNNTTKQLAVSTTLTVQTKTGPLTLKKKPTRIVTLSSSDTEIISALGGNVVGRSTAIGKVYPASAASIPEVGSAHGINFEKLAALKPDLVIGSPALQDSKATIEKLGAKMLFNSHNLYSEIQNSIRLYGQVLGKEEEAAKLLAQMDAKIRIAEQTKLQTKPKAIILYGAPGSFVVALPTSYPGNFLELAGGVNAGAAFPKNDQMPQYADLSMERIVAANPDAIFLIAHGDPAEIKASFKKELESNAAWKNLTAVKNDNFEVLDSELFAANPGLRAPDAVLSLNKLLRQVK
ncbi:ABC transporter substrate-binding protein [Cohnella soli]|uniref:ABC transporter substrate-binding protein n=1 Tax=Cohnella soli TaxID=425005 RepID=A0ABW0HLC3_9BACL